MGGAFALFGAFLAFAVPISVPLFAQRWRTLGIIVGLVALFFALVSYDLANPGGLTQVFGPFVFGLMLFGFGAGVIAKFVMMLGRR